MITLTQLEYLYNNYFLQYLINTLGNINKPSLLKGKYLVVWSLSRHFLLIWKD